MRCKTPNYPLSKGRSDCGEGSAEAGPGAGWPPCPSSEDENAVPYLPLQPAHHGVSRKQRRETDMIVSFRPHQLPLTLLPAPP